MIGYVGIWSEADNGENGENGEIEFYVFKEYRRQHYGVEALEALMNCFVEGKRCRGVGGNVSI